MRIAVFGATGHVGNLFITEALASGHEIVAYARNPKKITAHPRVQVVLGELTEKEKIEKAVSGVDVVVSVIGPVGTQHTLIFAPAYEHIVSAMKKAGVKRLITLGTPTIPDKNDGFSIIFWGLIVIVKLIIQKGHEDITRVGQIVRESGLEWTLVRVPLLTNGPRTKIAIGYFGNGIWWPWISRENFVNFLIQQLTDRAYIGKAPAISN